MKKLLISLFFLSASCISPLKDRTPSSFTSSQVADKIASIRGRAIDNFTENQCAEFLSKELQDFDSITASEALSSKFFADNKKSAELVAQAFQLRISLYEKFSQFDNPSNECVDLVRKAVRNIRFVEEAIIANISEGNNQSNIIFQAPPHSPQLRTIENQPRNPVFRSGDILLVRGKTFVSATIARIGDEEAQFSHIAFIYHDPQKKDLFVIESLIETGVKVTPIKTWLEEHSKGSVARITLIRSRYKKFSQTDISLCAKAAYDRANEALSSGTPIPYDFAMDMQTEDKLFCSEVVKDGCRRALKSQDHEIPVHPTTFTKMKDHSFLSRLGISTTQPTFSPADIEIDPNFKVVSEWVHPPSIIENQIMDAIMSELLRWMAEDDFDMEFGLMTNQIIPTAKSLITEIGINIPRVTDEFAKSVFVFWRVSLRLKNNTLSFALEFKENNGFYPLYHDFVSHLRKYRQRRNCQFLQQQGKTDSDNIFLYINQRPMFRESDSKNLSPTEIWSELFKQECVTKE